MPLTSTSVHHPGIVVVLEFQQVVRGVAQDERVVALGPAVEPAKWLGEERQVVSVGLVEQAFPASPLPEGDAEMSRVQRWIGVDAAGEVADNLVAEKVQGDAVGVAPGQRAAE